MREIAGDMEKRILHLFTALPGINNLGAVSGGKRISFEETPLKADVKLFSDEKDSVVKYQIKLSNESQSDIVLEDFFVDFPLGGITAGMVDDTDFDDYYILHPADQYGRRLLIMPYNRTQMELCEADSEAGIYRCYLYAAGRKRESCYQGRVWKNRIRELKMRGGEDREWTFYLTFTENDRQTSEILMRYGRVPLAVGDGVNAMRTLGHHFGEEPVSLHVYKELANAYHCAVFENGRLCSLKSTKGSVEAIDPDVPFGDICLKTKDGAWISTFGEGGVDGEDKHTQKFFGNGMAICSHFELNGKVLSYVVTLENGTEEKKEITDVKLPVSLNSRMGWGINPAERMIRHSQVAGDNSFFLATPCDGKAPFLMCVPHEGTRWELFDTDARDGKRLYFVHIHAEGAAQDAEEKEGGRWRLPVTHIELAAGEKRSYGFDFQWVDSYEEARRILVEKGKVDVRIVPGLTLPSGQKARILLKSKYKEITLTAKYPKETEIRLLSKAEGNCMYEVEFHRLGENRLTIRYGREQEGWIEMFSTRPVGELLEKRAAYIAKCQYADPGKWYDGLLRERNTKSGAMLDPDHHDEILGWRIYEITCDDPGLSKPAFLASKNAELPDEDEIKALDYYIEHFVWGGLQRTDEEEYPYGIYGIPDWHDLRERKNYNANELLHIWRTYDYPHIFLMYFKMYEIALNNPHLSMEHDAVEYLVRAYRTCLAMYQYPYEIEHSYAWSNGYWSPYQTGFYNELVILDIMDALRREGMHEQARRLEFHWQHKADFFIRECSDLFGSEYAFDTTGFETTQAIVDWGRRHAAGLYNSEDRSLLSYTRSQVEVFDQRQRACNIACRGYLENAYYITGSDIRGDSAHYTLGYMSQMGGWALLQDALYASDSPFELLRLGYTSLLSSWALLNAGTPQSNFGYWYPGAENDGASSGGFEAVPCGMTWLGQPAWHGVWIYGCETDLGYCGYIRGAAVIVADDPDFGMICYGGIMEEEEGKRLIRSVDGIGRQFHYVQSEEKRLHIVLHYAHMKKVCISERGEIILSFKEMPVDRAWMEISTHEDRGEIRVGKSYGAHLRIGLSGENQIRISWKL